LDGHLRRDLDPDMEVDVEVLDVSDDEARALLLSIDPLAALAQTQEQLQQRLLELTPTDSEDLRAAWEAAARACLEGPGARARAGGGGGAGGAGGGGAGVGAGDVPRGAAAGRAARAAGRGGAGVPGPALIAGSVRLSPRQSPAIQCVHWPSRESRLCRCMTGR